MSTIIPGINLPKKGQIRMKLYIMYEIIMYIIYKYDSLLKGNMNFSVVQFDKATH